MSGGYSLRTRLVRGATALDAKLEQWSWMKTIEFPAVAITGPTLVVLVAWMALAHGAPLPWSLGLAMTLGLAHVTPFMLREMRFFTPTETVGTRSTAPTSPAEDVSNFFVAQDYEGLSGQMESLTSEELEFLSELVGEYLEDNDDLNHTEFGFAKGVLDKIEEAMDA